MKKQPYRSVNRAIDDLPELFDTTERLKVSQVASRVKKEEKDEWIGSLSEAVELPNSDDRQKSMRLSQQLQIDIRSPTKKNEEVGAPINTKYTPLQSQRSVLVESQVYRLSYRIRYLPDSTSRVIALNNRQVERPRPIGTVSSVLMIDSYPRDVLPALLTNPNRLSKYIEALIGLMAHPNTTSSTVQNLELLVLLLTKLTQYPEGVEVRQTASDIDISFNRNELRKRDGEISQLRRKLADKDKYVRGMVQYYEEVISEMQENIQLLTRQRREYSEDRVGAFSGMQPTSEHNTSSNHEPIYTRNGRLISFANQQRPPSHSRVSDR